MFFRLTELFHDLALKVDELLPPDYLHWKSDSCFLSYLLKSIYCNLSIFSFYNVTVSSRFMDFAVPFNDPNGVHLEEFNALVDSLVLDNCI